MIDPRHLRPLRLGTAAIRRLLPHRPPLLLVDAVSAYAKEACGLRASRTITSAEPVFAGHFPDLWLWPGVYTIEGLAQSCALAGAIEALERGCAEHGAELAKVALQLERWEPLPPEGQALLSGPLSRAPMLASVDVKLLRPVFAGQRLEYEVARSHRVDPLHRFDVEGIVDGHLVARGTITVATRGGEG